MAYIEPRSGLFKSSPFKLDDPCNKRISLLWQPSQSKLKAELYSDTPSDIDTYVHMSYDYSIGGDYAAFETTDWIPDWSN